MTDLIDAPQGAAAPPAQPAPPATFAAPSGPPVVPVTPAPPAPAPTQPAAAMPPVPAPLAAPAAAAPGSAEAPPAAAPPAPPTPAAAPPAPEPEPDVAPAPAAPSVPPDHQPRQDQQRAPLPGTIPIDLTALQTPPKRRRTAGAVVGSIVKTVLWLAALGGMGYAAWLYGPELYDKYLGDGSEDVATDGVAIEDEPAAPLAFPAPSFPPVMAAATFELVDHGPDGATEYVVTTDFASGATETIIRRPGSTDLQMITIGEQALVRRTDDSRWYRTFRGGSPIDGPAARQHWVRLADELFPPEMRPTTRIDDAAHSQIAGVPTRRLVITVPDGAIVAPPPVPMLGPGATDRAIATAPPGAPGAVPPDPLAPDGALPARPVDGSLPLAASDAGGTVSGSTTIEVWIDDAGVIRQAVGPDLFGVDRVTVSWTTPDPWVPQMPDEAFVLPLDAEAIIHLGL